MDLFFIQKRHKVFGVIVAGVVYPNGEAIHVKLVGSGVPSEDTVHLVNGMNDKSKGEGSVMARVKM